MLRSLFRPLSTVAAILMLALPAAAADFPEHPVTIVVPFPPGGVQGSVVRIVQQKMETLLGQKVIVENRPGASANIGIGYVAKAPADGYILLGMATTLGAFPHLFSHLTYDPMKDLAVVGGFAETPTVCVVNANAAIQTFADLVKAAKDNPGSITYGSSGTGSPSHLIGELIAERNGIKFTHVPYKGGSLVVTDLLGNFINFSCSSLSLVLPTIQQGQLKAIAMTTKSRSAMLPDVPTLKELGFGDIDEGSRYVLFAPTGTPKPVMDKLTATLKQALADPSMKEVYGKLGFEVMTETPAEVQAMIQQQYDLWGPLIKELNLKLE